MDEKQAKQILVASGDLPQHVAPDIVPHSKLIPSISNKLPVFDNQRDLIRAIRESLALPEVISDEQINYQLSWCKWMATKHHDMRFGTIAGVKDHFIKQFLTDEGVANVIAAAEQDRKA